MNKAVVANIEEFSKLTPEQRKSQVENGEVKPPRIGTPERAQFNALMGIDDGSKRAPAPADQVALPPDGSTPVEPAAPAAEDKKYHGFATIDELVADYDNIKKLNQQRDDQLKAQAEITKRINNTASSQGRTIERLEADLELMKKRIAESDALIAAAASQAPAAGSTVEAIEPPDPNNFDEGVLDPQYHEAQVAYNRKLSEAYAALVKANADLRKDLTSMKPEIESVKGTVGEISKGKDLERQQKADSEFFAGVKQFQEEFGLDIGIDFETANQHLLVAQNPNSDPNEREAASAALKALKPEQTEALQKTLNAIHARYSFENGVRRERYRTWTGALADNDLADSYQRKAKQQTAADVLAAAAATKPTPTAQPGASAMPAGAGSPGSVPVSQQSSIADAKARLQKLEQLRGMNPAQFKADPKQWQEYKDLRTRFGYAVAR